MRGRDFVLGLALLAAIAAAIWLRPEPAPEPLAEAIARPEAGAAATSPASRRVAPAAGDIRSGLLEIGTRPPPTPPARDLFAAYSWLPPTPVAVAPPVVPVEAPTAPAPAFTYIGRTQAGNRRSYLFLDGEQTRILAIGDRIGDFRLDAAAGDSLAFTHLPTGLPVTVAAPAAGDH